MEIVRLLVLHDVEVNSVTEEGITALDLALEGGNTLIAGYLVKQGAKKG